MTNWKSPDELQEVDQVMFLKLTHALAGLYFISKKLGIRRVPRASTSNGSTSRERRSSIGVIFYFISLYFMLFTMIGLLIALNITSEPDCQVLYQFIGFVGQSCAGLPSLILAIRTMVIWGLKNYIVIPLVILMMGHWSFIWIGSVMKGHPVPGVLRAYKLTGTKVKWSQLVNLMFRDGLIYFVVAFIANVPAVVLMALNLNAVMGVVFNIPAEMLATIIACRAVRRLSNFLMNGPDILMTSKSINVLQSGPISFKRTRPAVSFANTGMTSDGAHVQMDTFSSADTDSRSDRVPQNEKYNGTVPAYDV